MSLSLAELRERRLARFQNPLSPSSTVAPSPVPLSLTSTSRESTDTSDVHTSSSSEATSLDASEEIETPITSSPLRLPSVTPPLPTSRKRKRDMLDIFNCNICFDTAYEPVLLSCDHLFCIECITKWMEQKQTCPICRKQFGVDEIKIRTYIKNTMDIMKNEEDVRMDSDEESKQEEIQPRLIDNNTLSEEHWRWKNDGKRVLKNGTVRTYYKCSENVCTAKKYVDSTPGSLPIVLIKGQHNHSPPTLPPLSRESRVNVRNLISVGLPPAEIERSLIHANTMAGRVSSSVNVASLQQIRNMANYVRRSSLPTSDVIQNANVMQGPAGNDWLVRFNTAPDISIVLIHSKGIDLLIRHGRTSFIDGTFDLIQDSLVCTILAVKVELPNGDWVVPVAFLIHSSRTTDTYSDFFRDLLRKCNNRWQPAFILGDYERAFRTAVNTVFSTSTRYFGDYFHFLQANLRWYRSNVNNQDWMKKALTESLRILFYSETAQTFRENQDAFLHQWDQWSPAYAEYFRNEWINTNPPSVWANYCRPTNQPTGSQWLEGINNVLQNVIFRGVHQIRLDSAIDRLWRFFNYYIKILESPSLCQMKISMINSERARWERSRRSLTTLFKRLNIETYFRSLAENEKQKLKELCDDFQQIAEASSTPTSDTNPSDRTTTTQQSDATNHSVTSNPITETVNTTTLESNRETPADVDESSEAHSVNYRTRRRTLGSANCPKCKAAAGNKACTRAYCYNCCVRDMSFECTYNRHETTKTTLLKASEISCIEEAIRTCRVVYINYAGGSNPGQERPIKPLKWETTNSKFLALDVLTNSRKSFFVKRVTRVSSQARS